MPFLGIWSAREDWGLSRERKLEVDNHTHRNHCKLIHHTSILLRAHSSFLKITFSLDTHIPITFPIKMDFLILNSKLFQRVTPFSLGIFMFIWSIHVQKLLFIFSLINLLLEGSQPRTEKGRKLLFLLYTTQKKHIISTHIKKWWNTHCFLLHIPPQAPQIEWEQANNIRQLLLRRSMPGASMLLKSVSHFIEISFHSLEETLTAWTSEGGWICPTWLCVKKYKARLPSI